MSASSTTGALQECASATRRAPRPTASSTLRHSTSASPETSCSTKGEARLGTRRWTTAQLRPLGTLSSTTSTWREPGELATRPHRARPPRHPARHQLRRAHHRLHHQRVQHHRLHHALLHRLPTLRQLQGRHQQLWPVSVWWSSPLHCLATRTALTSTTTTSLYARQST